MSDTPAEVIAEALTAWIETPHDHLRPVERDLPGVILAALTAAGWALVPAPTVVHTEAPFLVFNPAGGAVVGAYSDAPRPPDTPRRNHA